MVDDKEVAKLNQQGIWVTREGQRIPIGNIRDSHLLNIYNYLKRQAKAIARKNLMFYLTCDEPNGDMASLAFDSEWEFWCGGEEDPAGYLVENHPFYQHLMKELEKRELL